MPSLSAATSCLRARLTNRERTRAAQACSLVCTGMHRRCHTPAPARQGPWRSLSNACMEWLTLRFGRVCDACFQADEPAHLVDGLLLLAHVRPHAAAHRTMPTTPPPPPPVHRRAFQPSSRAPTPFARLPLLRRPSPLSPPPVYTAPWASRPPPHTRLCTIAMPPTPLHPSLGPWGVGD